MQTKTTSCASNADNTEKTEKRYIIVRRDRTFNNETLKVKIPLNPEGCNGCWACPLQKEQTDQAEQVGQKNNNEFEIFGDMCKKRIQISCNEFLNHPVIRNTVVLGVHLDECALSIFGVFHNTNNPSEDLVHHTHPLHPIRTYLYSKEKQNLENLQRTQNIMNTFSDSSRGKYLSPVKEKIIKIGIQDIRVHHKQIPEICDNLDMEMDLGKEIQEKCSANPSIEHPEYTEHVEFIQKKFRDNVYIIQETEVHIKSGTDASLLPDCIMFRLKPARSANT